MTYDLDHLGNWKETDYTPVGGSPMTELRRHNLVNQVTKVGSTAVTYDHGSNTGNPVIAQRGNGNIANDGTRIYSYDALNRLINVKSTASGTPQIAAYTYDALGRRVLKAVSAGVVGSIAAVTYRYLYDGQQIVEEGLFPSGTYSPLRQFVWGQYIDELVQINVPSNNTTPPLTAGKYYPLQDLLYRTIATTNGSGNIVEAFDYDAYGNTLMFNHPGGMSGTDWWANDAATTLQPICEYLFTGRQYDPETQIYRYRWRPYLPPLGRFISRDPIGYLGGIGIYEYVGGRSPRAVDPFGLADGFRGIMGGIANFFSGDSNDDVDVENGKIPRPPSLDPKKKSCQFLITVNGIDNSDAGASLYNDVTSVYTGYNEHSGIGTYPLNGSHGALPYPLHGDGAPIGISPFGDLAQIVFEELFNANDIAVVRTEAIIHDIAKQAKDNGCCCPTIHVFAHSQGTEIFFQALANLSQAERDMIDLHGYGGEMQFGNNLNLFSVQNVVNRGDLVPFIGGSNPVKSLFYLLNIFTGFNTQVVDNNIDPTTHKPIPGNHHTFHFFYLPSLSDRLPTRKCK